MTTSSGRVSMSGEVPWIEQIRAMAPSLGNAVHTIVAHYLQVFGSEELKKAWLPRMASGDAVGAIAMTEPGTGSDLQSNRTSAVKEGDDFGINGAKTFISNGYLADFVLTVCKTDPEGGPRAFSLILVETAQKVYGGTNEIMKDTIARTL